MRYTVTDLIVVVSRVIGSFVVDDEDAEIVVVEIGFVVD